MLRKERLYASKHGKSIDDIILDVIYTADESARNKIAAWKGWKELTMAKITEEGSTDKALGPTVFLPDQHPKLQSVKTDKAA